MARVILITGASSGIGTALALRYARAGVVLALLGRDQDRLAAVSARCREAGADVHIGALDVRDRDAMAEWIAGFERRFPIDLVIANAGAMAGTPCDGDIEPSDAAYELLQTNILGVVNTVQPLVAAMSARRDGQIAIVSSIAALIPLPDCPSYCASKSAVLSYGLSLRALLAPKGVRVSVICPGFVKTPMLARETRSKPFAMSADRAAELIARGLERNRAVIVFPATLAWLTKLHGLLPDRLRRWILARSRFTVAA